MTTIHLYCKVWSDIGFPSLSGYSISGCVGTRVTLAMIAEPPGRSGRVNDLNYPTGPGMGRGGFRQRSLEIRVAAEYLLASAHMFAIKS